MDARRQLIVASGQGPGWRSNTRDALKRGEIVAAERRTCTLPVELTFAPSRLYLPLLGR